MPAKLELYKDTGAKVFDSQHDRILSYLKTMTVNVRLPRPASVNNPTKGWFSANVTDSVFGSNTFALMKYMGASGWSSSWSPITPVLTYYSVSGNTLTLYVYTDGIYQNPTDIIVNIRLKIFRR